MHPFSHQTHSLVEHKQIVEPTRYARIDGIQLPWEVAPSVHGPVHRRMETMVVSGRQVNDTVVKLIRRRVRHQLLTVAHTIVLVVTLVGKCLPRFSRRWTQKLVYGKGSTLHLLN